jgi:hypothetical protein
LLTVYSFDCSYILLFAHMFWRSCSPRWRRY